MTSPYLEQPRTGFMTTRDERTAAQPSGLSLFNPGERQGLFNPEALNTDLNLPEVDLGSNYPFMKNFNGGTPQNMDMTFGALTPPERGITAAQAYADRTKFLQEQQVKGQWIKGAQVAADVAKVGVGAFGAWNAFQQTKLIKKGMKDSQKMAMANYTGQARSANTELELREKRSNAALGYNSAENAQRTAAFMKTHGISETV